MKKSVLLILCLLLLLSSCSNGKNTAETSSPHGEKENIQTQTPSEKDNPIVLVDDDFIKMSYVEVFEAEGIEGVFYLRLKVENKTDQPITIYLADASVNDVSTMALSGIPMTIQPEKSSLNPFFFSYGNLDFSELEELRSIEFRVEVENSETFANIETTDFVIITI